jgi:drug/metabolite transporter (DMT)-like permease
MAFSFFSEVPAAQTWIGAAVIIGAAFIGTRGITWRRKPPVD